MRFKYIIKNNPLSVIFLVLILISSSLLFMYNRIYGIIFFAGLISLSVLWIWWNIKSFNHTSKAMKLLEDNLKNSGSENNGLNSNPFPVVLTDENGNIVWFSSKFSDIADDFIDFSGNSINEILESINCSNSVIYDSAYEVKGFTKSYTLYPFSVDDSLKAYYFSDTTYYKDVCKKYDNSLPVIIFVAIDSLEINEENLDHIDYTSLVADIERIISKWFADYSCTFRKINEGKFFSITEKINLDRMQSEGFSVLDEARLANSNSKLEEATLTMGIGCSDIIKNAEQYAREALELAKGRGGDQVAVNVDDNYTFYGGKSSIKERKGRIQLKHACVDFDAQIEKSENIYVLGHSYSDFDSLGACIGVAAICKAAKKNVYIVCNKQKSLAKPLLEYFKNSDSHIRIVSPEECEKLSYSDSLAILCDTNSVKLAESKYVLAQSDRVILIDHHRLVPGEMKTELSFHDAHASSACELVTEIIEYSKFKTKVTPEIATALLTGIILDTKNFSLRAGVRTFEAAAYLKDKAADTVIARKMFTGTKEQNIKTAQIIGNAMFYSDYVIGINDEESEDSRIISSKAADSLLEIAGMKSSYVIYKVDGVTNISARSNTDFNVQLVMEKMNGGGHANMAACQLGKTSIEDAKQLLIQNINLIKGQ